MKPYPNEWTPERVAELKRRFADGESFATIVGGMALTRMAVIGKCNRLGLTRPPPSKPKAPFVIRPPHNRSANAKAGNMLRKLRCDPTKNKTFNKIVAGPKFNPEPVNLNPAWLEYDLAIPKRRRKNVFTLGPRDCRYAVGDPGTPDFFFCGAVKVSGLPYCATHAARCFVPARS